MDKVDRGMDLAQGKFLVSGPCLETEGDETCYQCCTVILVPLGSISPYFGDCSAVQFQSFLEVLI
jgi:hypothetical protein